MLAYVLRLELQLGQRLIDYIAIGRHRRRGFRLAGTPACAAGTIAAALVSELTLVGKTAGHYHQAGPFPDSTKENRIAKPNQTKSNQNKQKQKKAQTNIANIFDYDDVSGPDFWQMEHSAQMNEKFVSCLSFQTSIRAVIFGQSLCWTDDSCFRWIPFGYTIYG